MFRRFNLLGGSRHVLAQAAVKDRDFRAEPDGATGRIDGGVPTADDGDPVAQLFVSLHPCRFIGIEIPQEFDAAVHARLVLPLHAHLLASVRAGCEVNDVEILADLVKGNGLAHTGVALDLHAQAADVVDFPVQDVPGKAVGGNRPAQHSSRVGQFLEDRHAVAPQRQVACGGESRRSGADDGDLLFPGNRHRDDFGPGRIVRDEPLQELDGNRLVHLAATAFGLALVIADPSAHRGEGVGPEHDFVRILETLRTDQGDIGGYVHPDRAGVLAGRLEQRRADRRTAVFLMDVLLVFLAEIAKCAQHRVRRRLPEAAERGILDDGGHLFEQLDVPLLAFSLRDVRQDLEHPFGALPAGGALAAGFILAEIHEETGHVDGAVVLVHDDQSARTHDGAELGDLFVVDRRIEMLDRNAAAGGAAQLRSLEFLAFGDSAADVVNDGSQRRSHRDFDQSDVVDVTGQGEDLCPLALFRSDAGVPLRTLEDDLADVGQGFDVVQDAGLLPEAGDGGKGGPGAGHSPLALDGCHQRRFLAADEGAGALVDLQVEIEARSQDVLSQQARFLGLGDGDVEAVDGQGIFGPAVDVAVMGADGLGGDHHALQDSMGIRLENAAVHESARIALVGVAEYVLDVTGGLGCEFPLQSGRESGAAAAPQTGVQDFPDDVFRFHLGEGFGHSGVSVPGDVFLNFFRVDQTPVSQNAQFLKRKERDFLHGRNHRFRGGFPVQQTLQDSSLDQMFFHQFGNVILPDLHVDDPLGIDHHDGAHGAEAVASGFHDFYFFGKSPLQKLGNNGLLDVQAS